MTTLTTLKEVREELDLYCDCPKAVKIIDIYIKHEQEFIEQLNALRLKIKKQSETGNE